MLSRKTQFDLLNFQACCSFKIQTVFFFNTFKKTEVVITYGFHVFFRLKFHGYFCLLTALFNWTVIWKVNRNKFRSLREIRGNVNWNFDLNFFMQKVFHKKISNSLSYAVHMIWRIKDPFWVCILSQDQTKVLWTKAVTWQMTRERWQKKPSTFIEKWWGMF